MFFLVDLVLLFVSELIISSPTTMLGGRSVGHSYHNKLWGGKQHGLRIFLVTAHGFDRAVLPPHVTRAKAYITCVQRRMVGRSVVTTRNLLTVHPRTPLFAFFVYLIISNSWPNFKPNKIHSFFFTLVHK